MYNLAIFFYLLVAFQARATRSDALQVTNHSLTLLSITVAPLDGCIDTSGYRHCVGELSGRTYTWAQENQETNYVLFILSRRASISEISLTYSVDSTSQTPKVSFCAAPDDTSINITFPNITCKEVTIEATDSATRTARLPTPFTNITNSVVMEVITQGIKASFTATSIQFSGTYEAMETTSSPNTITSGTVISSDRNQLVTESISSNTTNGVSHSPMQTSNIHLLIAALYLVLGL